MFTLCFYLSLLTVGEEAYFESLETEVNALKDLVKQEENQTFETLLPYNPTRSTG